MPPISGSLGLALSALCAGGCSGPVGIAHTMGVAGWFALSPVATMSPEAAPDSLAEAYATAFDALPLGLTTPPCPSAADALDGAREIYILVHGVEGDGPEWHSVTATLSATEGAAIFMFRWVPYDQRDAVVEKLSAGVTRLLQCLGRRRPPIWVLAHSAGGVVASLAASRFASPPPLARIRVVTVASPLAGTVARPRNEDGRQEARFMLDLGSAIDGYPPAAAGVEVVHLRTHPPADPVMATTEEGHVPNSIDVGVPGAPQIDLPAALDHTNSLVYVARRLVAGETESWFSEPTP